MKSIRINFFGLSNLQFTIPSVDVFSMLTFGQIYNFLEVDSVYASSCRPQENIYVYFKKT